MCYVSVQSNIQRDSHKNNHHFKNLKNLISNKPKKFLRFFYSYFYFEVLKRVEIFQKFKNIDLLEPHLLAGDDTRVFGLEPLDSLLLGGLVAVTDRAGDALLLGNVESLIKKIHLFINRPSKIKFQQLG